MIDITCDACGMGVDTNDYMYCKDCFSKLKRAAQDGNKNLKIANKQIEELTKQVADEKSSNTHLKAEVAKLTAAITGLNAEIKVLKTPKK